MTFEIHGGQEGMLAYIERSPHPMRLLIGSRGIFMDWMKAATRGRIVITGLELREPRELRETRETR